MLYRLGPKQPFALNRILWDSVSKTKIERNNFHEGVKRHKRRPYFRIQHHKPTAYLTKKNETVVYEFLCYFKDIVVNSAMQTYLSLVNTFFTADDAVHENMFSQF